MRRLILPLAIPLLLLAGCKQPSQAPSTATTSDVAGAASTPFAYEEASVAELQKQMAAGTLTSLGGCHPCRRNSASVCRAKRCALPGA